MIVACRADAIGAQLYLTWSDNSVGETGFSIERRVGTTGAFGQIATTPPGATAYTDSSVADGTTYCYRVRAFNEAGYSDYSNTDCGTTPQVFGLAVLKIGAGSGTVTSAPAGIACGASCSGTYPSGTSVTLTASAGAGSAFIGWSGAGCSGTGLCTVSLMATMTVTATFALQSVPLSITKTGAGTVTSTPAGITCGSTCATSFPPGASVTLSASPAAGSSFTGWSGAGCSGTGPCTVSLTAATTVTATFAPAFPLTITKAGTGSGTVTSTPPGISCGTTCSSSFPGGTSVTLSATPAAGSIFSGWSGRCSGAGACSVAVTAPTAVTATFAPQAAPDTTPPTAPAGLSAAAGGSSQITLGWAPSTDNLAVTGYRVERCQGTGCASFLPVATPTGTAFTDTGLIAATTYTYRVAASDAAGNLSTYSNTATVTTLPPPPATGLVAAYAFNEAAGNTVADSSGNNNPGVVSGPTWTPQGKFGSALVFGGANARVIIGDSPSLRLTTGMTLEAWVNPSTVTNIWRDVIFKGNDNYYLEATSPSGVPVAGGTFGKAFGVTALPVNTWTHLAATYDGATLRLYVNGVPVSSSRSAPIATSSNPLEIGGDSIYGQYFQGAIDEVRIYNRALSPAEIQTDMNTPVASTPDTTPPTNPTNLSAVTVTSNRVDLAWTASTDNTGVIGYRVERCQGTGCASFLPVATPTGTAFTDTGLIAATTYTYRVAASDAAGNLSTYSNTATATTLPPPPATGLVAAYAFNEAAGNTVADSSGNNNPGVVSGPTWTPQGKFGSALVFGGANARVIIGDSPSLRLTTGMTLEAWVNPSTVTNIWRDVIFKGNDNYYLEATSPSGVPVAGGTFGKAFGVTALPVNTWTHLAATYDGATLRLYVNGVPVSSSRSAPIATSSNPLEIGGDSIYGQYFQGAIDEVRIYNRALSPAEIQTDMNTPVR